MLHSNEFLVKKLYLLLKFSLLRDLFFNVSFKILKTAVNCFRNQFPRVINLVGTKTFVLFSPLPLHKVGFRHKLQGRDKLRSGRNVFGSVLRRTFVRVSWIRLNETFLTCSTFNQFGVRSNLSQAVLLFGDSISK